ncbi:MAG: U32 family peptidase, partial [Deltaproteobacteria bacterium]|nr:U32 family peptidase [Deltaproteobacteria bacterium]
MKLVIPAMFGEGFLDDLAPDPVRWMYGSLPEEPGGRPRAWLPSVDLAGFGQRIADARERGIGFMYTLNASCSGNREQTAEGQRALAERLGWLTESGAEGVVATSPYVVEMVKRRFPELRVCVSTLANVDDVDKALYFENLGVEAIYLPEYLNRDFKLLSALRRRLIC